ncbi:MAG TPA: hypothetical protein VMH40_18940 [Myxococcaceae bacterium]|nr:hypothetical protein [Myxococcaceae bacterium]
MRSSPTPAAESVRRGAVLLLVLLVAGAVATAVAASRYPGGTWMDRGTVGHSFWGNFLCDVARTPALDGRPHPGASWGRAAEWSLVLALSVFFWIAPALVDPPRRRRTIRVLGLVAALGLALVPVTVRVPHALALIAGAGPGFAATVLLMRGLRPRPLLALLGALALGLSVLELALYLVFREGFFGAPLPPAVPAVQRLAVIAVVTWMGACALAVLGQVPGAPRGASGSPRAT